MEKSCVYVDGFNLYYGLKDMGWRQYYWLDIENLARSFIINPEKETLGQVKYFTAKVRRVPKEGSRQHTYLNALSAHCPKLIVLYGRFLEKQRQCYKCGYRHTFYEEKKTDVNIASHILMDAFHQKHDRIYVVSGDSDLVPAVEMVKELNACPTIIIANPPRRKSDELCNVADGWFSISEKKFQLSQLPEMVRSKKGAKLTRPAEWR